MSRSEVLYSFRSLMRTARRLFREDEVALNKARIKIRHEFNKNKGVTDAGQVEQLLSQAKQARGFLAQHVVQIKANNDESRDAPFYVRLDKDTARVDGELETIEQFKQRTARDEK